MRPLLPEDIAIILMLPSQESYRLPEMIAGALLADPLAFRLRSFVVELFEVNLPFASLSHHQRLLCIREVCSTGDSAGGASVSRDSGLRYVNALVAKEVSFVIVLSKAFIFAADWMHNLLAVLNTFRNDGVEASAVTLDFGDQMCWWDPLANTHCTTTVAQLLESSAIALPVCGARSASLAAATQRVEPSGIAPSGQKQRLFAMRRALLKRIPSSTSPLPCALASSPGPSPLAAPSSDLNPVVVTFGIVMAVVESPAFVERAIFNFRQIHPHAPFVIVSDGIHHDRYSDIATEYAGLYYRGTYLKTPMHGAAWWQRTFELGLSLNTKYVLKVDPDTRFHRAIKSWPNFDCFGTVTCRGSKREHIQGGVQGFRMETVRAILASRVCHRSDFLDIDYWAWDKITARMCRNRGYLSTDQVLRRILIEVGCTWGHWGEVRSWYRTLPPRWRRYAISHPHKF